MHYNLYLEDLYFMSEQVSTMLHFELRLKVIIFIVSLHQCLHTVLITFNCKVWNELMRRAVSANHKGALMSRW